MSGRTSCSLSAKGWLGSQNASPSSTSHRAKGEGEGVIRGYVPLGCPRLHGVCLAEYFGAARLAIQRTQDSRKVAVMLPSLHNESGREEE